MPLIDAGADQIAQFPRAMLVEIVATSGSTPRDEGVAMLVSADRSLGTIGGGAAEWQAMRTAREALVAGGDDAVLEVTLGPALGQCCGGKLRLRLRPATPALRATLRPNAPEALTASSPRPGAPRVWVFGAGPVGMATACHLAQGDLAPQLVDTREALLRQAPQALATHLTAIPEAMLLDARPGEAVVITTHDHALDFALAEAALARPELAYVGMIGSQSKRAQLAARVDVTRLTCPIGAKNSRDKRPAAIAASTAAEIRKALKGPL